MARTVTYYKLIFQHKQRESLDQLLFLDYKNHVWDKQSHAYCLEFFPASPTQSFNTGKWGPSPRKQKWRGKDLLCLSCVTQHGPVLSDDRRQDCSHPVTTAVSLWSCLLYFWGWGRALPWQGWIYLWGWGGLDRRGAVCTCIVPLWYVIWNTGQH